jgi:hypothetical protein
MNERQTALGKGFWVAVRSGASVRTGRRPDRAFITALAVDGLFARKEDLRVELLRALTAAADVTRSGRGAEQEREQRQRGLPSVAPKMAYRAAPPICVFALTARHFSTS